MNRTIAVLLVALVTLAGVPAGAVAAPSAVAQSDAVSQSSGPVCEYPQTLTDATGAEVTVEEEPERVVVTGASGAQTMWELEQQSKVVGMPVQPYTTYLPGAEEKTDVTNQDGTLNVERTINASPDIVLAANITSNTKVEQLREANVTVYTFALADSIPSIYAKTNTTGSLVGACDAAASVVTEMQNSVNAVQARADGFPANPSVFVHLGSGYTATAGSFQHDLVTTAGGENIATELNTSAYGQVSQEAVIEANPDFIVVPMSNTSADPATRLPDAYDSLTAVQEDQVIGVDGNYFSQPAPRVVRPLGVLSVEFYAWANEQSTTTETTTETTTTESTTETTAAQTTTTESGGTPGFGPLVALAALAAALFVARKE